jgi:hypothetical protein
MEKKNELPPRARSALNQLQEIVNVLVSRCTVLAADRDEAFELCQRHEKHIAALEEEIEQLKPDASGAEQAQS